MFNVEEGSSRGGGSEMDDEITGDDSTTSLSRWVFDEKNKYDEMDEDDYDDEGYDEHQHREMDSDDEDGNVEQRLIRTSPAVDSFDVDALEIPGTRKKEIEDSSIGRKLILALQTLGVVFGDIGTSPLYTFSVMFNRSSINDKKI